MTAAATIATVALAIVAAVALLLNGAAATEAYRSRIDSVAQREVVSSFENSEQVFTVPNFGMPQSIQGGTKWDLPQYDAHPLTIKAKAVVSNEGQVTLFAKVSDPSLHAEFTWRTNEQLNASRLLRPQIMDDWSLVPPGYDVVIELSWTRKSEEWWSDYLRFSDGKLVPTTKFDLLFRDATGSAFDRCECEFGMIFMGTDPRSTNCIILPPLNPGEVRPKKATIGMISRTYPLESSWYRPFRNPSIFE